MSDEGPSQEAVLLIASLRDRRFCNIKRTQSSLVGWCKTHRWYVDGLCPHQKARVWLRKNGPHHLTEEEK